MAWLLIICLSFSFGWFVEILCPYIINRNMRRPYHFFCLSVESIVPIWPLNKVCHWCLQGTSELSEFYNGSEMWLVIRLGGGQLLILKSALFWCPWFVEIFSVYIKWPLSCSHSLLSSRRSNFKYHCPCYSNLDRANYHA